MDGETAASMDGFTAVRTRPFSAMRLLVLYTVGPPRILRGLSPGALRGAPAEQTGRGWGLSVPRPLEYPDGLSAAGPPVVCKTRP